uniref:Reverse transcriptase domain-containing protein n=1 Tax=Schistocephalus solidus TaxID=70667 RepID=A0A183SZY4_SCHSO
LAIGRTHLSGLFDRLLFSAVSPLCLFSPSILSVGSSFSAVPSARSPAEKTTCYCNPRSSFSAVPSARSPAEKTTCYCNPRSSFSAVPSARSPAEKTTCYCNPHVTIVHFYKRKGNRHLCDNHRGISLLKIAKKLFTRILLNRLNGHLEQDMLPESQCGFRRHCGTTDMIFVAGQLQEKCQEILTHLFTTFVDLKNAFDPVNLDRLWKCMQKFGCPERFTHMVRQLHDGMTARVNDNGKISEAFAVTNGMKQGCVLAPNLFNLMFSVMLTEAYRDNHPGIHIAYRMGGRILKQKRRHFRSRVSTAAIRKLRFTEDCALNASTQGEIQRSMDLFATACDNFVISINTPPNTIFTEAHINFNGAQLQSVDTVLYLGINLSRSNKVHDEIAHWIAKADQAFGSMQYVAWN